MAFVYILYCKDINKYYIGSCIDLNVRINRHLNHTGGSTTKHYNYKLSCYSKFESIQEARKIEKLLKSYKGGN